MKNQTVFDIQKPVSRMVFGTAGASFLKGEDQTELLDAVFEMGIRCFDTARVYGKSEQVFGNWLEKRNLYDQVVIITKGAHPSLPLWRKRVNEKEIRRDLEESCRLLKTKYIDIWFLHRDDPEIEAGQIVEILNALHAEGRIGAFGGSNWTHQRIQEANEYACKHNLVPFTVSSPNFSLAHQVTDPWGGGCVTITGPENAEARAWYAKNQMPVFAYSSLANGLFSGRWKSDDPESIRKGLSKESMKGYGYQENYQRLARCEHMAEEKGCTVSQIALAWILRQEMNVYPIVTSASPERMRSNLAAAQVELSEEECRFLLEG